ncbi:Vesicle-associated membrane protein 711 [Citrus sinensis]|uniref:Vesicle-associated membrane protein 711 n=1 Tax=Citrus sinensis TaxID=2711 RepID=A0ACB8P570_CITSI|nr:Vesicle-associated membrane protein 711 [Citrus sinensis]
MTSDPAHKSTDLNEIEASPQICGQPRGDSTCSGTTELSLDVDLMCHDVFIRQFVKTYGRSIHSAAAYAMNDEFSRILSKQMDHYSNDPNADRLNRLKGEMSHVRSVMIDNIEKIVERGDRLNLLVDKTATLHRNTIRFKRQARKYKSSVCWGNCKLASGLVCVILIIIYVTLAFYCRDPLWRYCFE